MRAMVRTLGALLALAAAERAEAGLILQPGFTDRPFRFSAEWKFDPEAADSQTPNFLNWNVTLSLVQFPVLGDWLAQATVQHRVNPHASETLPNPITLSAFVINAARPTLGAAARTVTHPGLTPPHEDRWLLTFLLGDLPANNRITLASFHPTDVPEPGTIALLGTAIVGLICTGRRRFGHARPSS